MSQTGPAVENGEAANRGVVRKFFETHPGEHIDQFERCRVGSTNRHGTERNESGERSGPQARAMRVAHLSSLH